METTAFKKLIRELNQTGHYHFFYFLDTPIGVLAHILTDDGSMQFFPRLLEHISLDAALDCVATNLRKNTEAFVDYLSKNALDAHLPSCFDKAITHRNITLFKALQLKFPHYSVVKACLAKHMNQVLSANIDGSAGQWLALFLEYELPIPSPIPRNFLRQLVLSGDYTLIRSRITKAQLCELLTCFTEIGNADAQAFQSLYNDIQQKLFEQVQGQQAIDDTLDYAHGRLQYVLNFNSSDILNKGWLNPLLNLKHMPESLLGEAIYVKQYQFVQQFLEKYSLRRFESIFSLVVAAAKVNPEMLGIILNALNLHLLNPLRALGLPQELLALTSQYLAIQSNMTDALFSAINKYNLNTIQLLVDHDFIDYQQTDKQGNNVFMTFVNYRALQTQVDETLANALFDKFLEKRLRVTQRDTRGRTVFNGDLPFWEEQCATHLITKLCASHQQAYLTDIDPEALRCTLGLRQHEVSNKHFFEASDMFVDSNAKTLVFKNEQLGSIPLEDLPREFPKIITNYADYRPFEYEIYKILHKKNPIFLGPPIPPEKQMYIIPNIPCIALSLACNPGTQSLPFTVHLAVGKTRVFAVGLLACALLQNNSAWYDALIAKGVKHLPSDLELIILLRKSLPDGLLPQYMAHMQEQGEGFSPLVHAMLLAANVRADLIVNQLVHGTPLDKSALLQEIGLLFSDNTPAALLDKLFQPGVLDEQTVVNVLLKNEPMHHRVLQKILQQYPRIEQRYVSQFIFQNPALHNSAYWKKLRQQRAPNLSDVIEHVRGLHEKSNTLWTSHYSGHNTNLFMDPLFLHTVEHRRLEEAKLMVFIKMRETVQTLGLESTVAASPATRATPTMQDLQQNMEKLGLTMDWNVEVPVKKRTSIFSTEYISLAKHITAMRLTNPIKFKALCNASTQVAFENELKIHRFTCCKGDTTSWKIFDQIRPRAAS